MSRRVTEEIIVSYHDFIRNANPYLHILRDLGIDSIIDSIIGQDGLIHIILRYSYRVTDAIEYFNTEIGCNEYFTLSGANYNEIIRKLDYISVCYVLGTLERWH